METVILAAILVVLIYSVITNQAILARNSRYVSFMVALHKAQLMNENGLTTSDRAYLLDLLDDVL